MTQVGVAVGAWCLEVEDVVIMVMAGQPEVPYPRVG